jgi:hypothetical protein
MPAEIKTLKRERAQLPKNQIDNADSHFWKTRLLKYLFILHSHQPLEKIFWKISVQFF